MLAVVGVGVWGARASTYALHRCCIHGYTYSQVLPCMHLTCTCTYTLLLLLRPLSLLFFFFLFYTAQLFVTFTVIDIAALLM